jgi:two-component system nitrogen regulation response regulator NtrX
MQIPKAEEAQREGKMTADILVIDDEEDICLLIQGILEDEGYSTRSARNAEQAYAAVEKAVPDLVILDIWLQNSHHDGLQVLESLKDKYPNLPVVMISGHGNIETAVSAIKQGAYEFIEKPFKSDRLILLVRRALETASLKSELHALKKQNQDAAELMGDSHAMVSVKQILSRVAPTNSRVLITGEPGTGKNITARVLHQTSARAGGPYMMLNCAIMHPDHIEAELFGVEKGAGSSEGKTGVLEQANGGTLLLDEVADMPLETQGKIVRVLQEQRFRRLGGEQMIEVDVRIVASTNRDLQKNMTEGNFRQDLFYRLNVVPIQIAPLRERLQDIPVLARYFMDLYSRHNGVPAREFSQSAIAAMQSYDWPGNVRQLRNMIEWIMIMQGNGDPVIKAEHLPPEIGIHPASGGKGFAESDEFLLLPLREARESFEKKYLLSQIERFNGNISRTAQFIGMERSALHRKLKMLDVTASIRHSNDKDDQDAETLRKVG